MDRVQFMEQLEKLLSDISENERREALDYYESYFDEAGPEREADVIRELGSPGKVAAIIKEDLREHGEYGEESCHDKSMETQCQEKKSDRAERGYRPRPRRGAGAIALIIILLIFLAPFFTGTVGGILGMIVTIIFLPFLIIIVTGAAVIGLIVGGLVTLFAGAGVCMANPAMGVLSIGIGCILMAAGLLGTVFLVWFASRLLPRILRGITDFCHRLLQRERRESAGL